MSDIVALLLDDDLPPSRLGAMLHAARKRSGLKRRVVAARVGISRDRLRAYERGSLPVPAEVCAGLAECYGEDLTAHVPLRVPVLVEEGWIIVGNKAKGHPTRSEADVLRNYVDVLTRLRGAKAGEPVALRAADLEALAGALGGDATEIEDRIVSLLRCTREEAATLRHELLRRKVILPVAGLAAGAALFAGAGASAGAQDSAPAPIAPSPTTVSQAEPDWAVVDEAIPRASLDETVVEAAPTSRPPATARAIVTPPPEPEAEPTAPAVTNAPDPAPAPEPVTDATVPPSEVEEDVPVSIPEGEVFVEIGDAITEP